MPRTGRPKAEFNVTAEESAELERLARRMRTNRHLALRAKMILRCAERLTNIDVGKALKVSNATVGKWRKRFNEHRVEGLYDEPKPGRPRQITDEALEAVVVKTLEDKPKGGRTHWSTGKMAEAAGISHSTVGRIWRTFGLQPHMVRTFKISDDPLFIEKVRDIVGLYVDAPDHAVVCVDEKPQIQALERAQPILPMDFGMPERQTHNYSRCSG